MSFAVFLSHSSADKPAVEELARRLAKEGIQAWLDKWHLIPGDEWQPAIEKALAESETCAVFIGPSGFGPWQNEEMRAAIAQRVSDSRRRFRVIPVLLPGAERGDRSSLPTFLTATTWVEFRDSLDDENAFHRLVCGIRGVQPGTGPSEAIYEGQCPYRGLRVFDVGDAPFFFGREALLGWLLDEIQPVPADRVVNRFLAILGASGSGKSSLARAGLIAALKNGAIPGSSSWPLAILRPGPDPLESLAVALSGALNVAKSASALNQLIEDFQKSEKALHLIGRQALPEPGPELRLVVLVDQFEEIFTLCTKEELREELIRNLLYAAKVGQGQTLVILTMRADFYAKCATNAELAAAFSDHNFLVGPMADHEMRDAIERPAQLVGCELEGGLVDLLLQDVRNQPGALPLLQHALLELWKKRDGRRLTVRAYQEIGKLEGALRRRADATFEALSQEEQEICRRTFLRLTQPGEGTEDTKRRALMRELAPVSGGPAAEEVVQKLANASLLTTEGDLNSKDASVEVAHEALIRSWPQLRQWIDADRAGLRTRIRLTEAADEWKNAGRDPAYLYTGARLAVAKEWQFSHPNEASTDEAEFLRCSREAQEHREAAELEAARKLADALRERAEEAEKAQRLEEEHAREAEKRAKEQKESANKLRRRAFVAAGAAGVALILLAISVIMWRASVSARAAAEEQARIANVRSLAAESSSALKERPMRSLLLAVEAIRAAQSLHGVRLAAPEQSMREALAAIGGRPVARTEGAISAVATSPDNHWFVTGGWDGTVRLWDLSAKDPWADPVVLRGPQGRINAVAISADNHWVVSGGSDKTACLWDLSARDPAANSMMLRGHESSIYSVAISADNHWVVTASEDHTARLWDLSAKDPTASPVVLRGHDGAIAAVAISPDCHWVVTGSTDRTARLWDLEANNPAANPVVLRGHKALVRAVAISRDSRWVVTGSFDGTACLWDLKANDPAANPVVLPGHVGLITAVAISPDNHWVVTAGYDKTACLWDLSAEHPEANLMVLRGHEGVVWVVAISPNSRWLVTGSADGTARLWDLRAKDPGANPVVLRGHDSWVSAVAISAANDWVLTASYDKSVRLWDLSAKDQIASPVILRGDPVDALAISLDNHWLVTSGDYAGARLWDLRAKDPAANVLLLRGHQGRVNAVAISPDSHWGVTGSQDNTARLWDLRAKDPAANPVVLQGHERPVAAVAISADSHWVVTGSWDKTARLWDLSAKDPAANPVVLRGHGDSVTAVAISVDSRWVVTASADHTARLWDLKAKDPLASPMILRGHEREVTALAISPDNHWLATASKDSMARLWNLRAKDPASNPLVLRGHEGGITALAISPDNHWLVTASDDSTAHLWDLRAENPAANPVVLRGHESGIHTVAMSPDNRWVVTGSADKTARLWDLSAKDPAANPVVLRGHEAVVYAVAISSDNHWVVTGGSADRTTRLWLLQVEDLISLARTIVGRNLSGDESTLYFPGEKYHQTFPELPVPK